MLFLLIDSSVRLVRWIEMIFGAIIPLVIIIILNCLIEIPRG